MIVTENLSRHFGPLKAVEALTLSIERGEVFGLLGPNGAGKTTTVRMLAALIAPTTGRARVNGHDVVAEPAAVRASIGILTETPGLYTKLNALQNLRLFGELHLMEPSRIEREAQRYLELLDLWDRRSEAVGGFSKGMRQKLALARAFLHRPAVVFLDEPTSALDPASARLVREFLAELKGEGRTIVLCTHNLHEAERLCDRIAIIRGALLQVGTPAELREAFGDRRIRLTLASDPLAWAERIRGWQGVEDVVVEGGAILVDVADPEAESPGLVRDLVTAGAEVRYVEPLNPSLEDVYLKLVHRDEVVADPQTLGRAHGKEPQP